MAPAATLGTIERAAERLTPADLALRVPVHPLDIRLTSVGGSYRFALRHHRGLRTSFLEQAAEQRSLYVAALDAGRLDEARDRSSNATGYLRLADMQEIEVERLRAELRARLSPETTEPIDLERVKWDPEYREWAKLAAAVEAVALPEEDAA